MAVEHTWVGVIEDRGLDPALHERVRIPHEELIQSVLARHEHREPLAAPASTAPLLAQARHRARETDRERAVEETYVDAELECVGRGDAEEVALDEPLLDLAALCGRVARAVRGKTRGQLRSDALRGEAVDELRGLA